MQSGPVGRTLWPSEQLDFEKTQFHHAFLKDRALHTTGDFLTVNKNSEVLDAAMSYAITQIVAEDVGQKFIVTMGLAPSYNGLERYEELDEGETKDVLGVHLSRWEGFSQYPEKADATIHYPGHDGFKIAAYFRDTLNAALEAALLEEATVEEAVTDAVADINAELAAES
jgi:ABC-type glycerol-3-phosphate transport system substrate-binding protein